MTLEFNKLGKPDNQPSKDLDTFPAPENVTAFFAPSTPPQFNETCTRNYYRMRLDKMARHVQRDMRSIAAEIVGSPRQYQQPQQYITTTLVVVAVVVLLLVVVVVLGN